MNDRKPEGTGLPVPARAAAADTAGTRAIRDLQRRLDDAKASEDTYRALAEVIRSLLRGRDDG